MADNLFTLLLVDRLNNGGVNPPLPPVQFYVKAILFNVAGKKD